MRRGVKQRAGGSGDRGVGEAQCQQEPCYTTDVDPPDGESRRARAF